jgi:hypothetical protein
MHEAAAGAAARWTDTCASSSSTARKVRCCAASSTVNSRLARFCHSCTS